MIVTPETMTLFGSTKKLINKQNMSLSLMK